MDFNIQLLPAGLRLNSKLIELLLVTKYWGPKNKFLQTNWVLLGYGALKCKICNI
uniref:Uncharacterized protein n=1 Tax=Anguilla anguilla TaxID=7936 RepID=A0A0E9WEP3_ANGAN